jgi:hypothetical protein
MVWSIWILIYADLIYSEVVFLYHCW